MDLKRIPDGPFRRRIEPLLPYTRKAVALGDKVQKTPVRRSAGEGLDAVLSSFVASRARASSARWRTIAG